MLLEQEVKLLETVSSFEEAGDVALAVLSRLKQPGRTIVQFCGPITTGGLGDPLKNRKRFHLVIRNALRRDVLVFNQMPFEDVIDRLRRESNVEGYCTDILEVFYRKIFESRIVGLLLFLPGWETSVGARWERELAKSLGIPVGNCPTDWVPGVVADDVNEKALL